MFELTQYLLFVGASVLLLVTPGPAVLFVVARAVDHGRRAGVVSSLGLAIGTLVHLFAVVLGLSAILMTSAALYTGIKIAGAAYLIAMGVRRLLTRDEPKISNDKPPVASGKLLLEGIVVNALNPKPAIFFLAFLPQFADPAGKGVRPTLHRDGQHVYIEPVAVKRDGARFLTAEEIPEEGIVEPPRTSLLPGYDHVKLDFRAERERTGSEGLCRGAEGIDRENGSVPVLPPAINDLPLQFSIQTAFGHAAANGELSVDLNAVPEVDLEFKAKRFVDIGGAAIG